MKVCVVCDILGEENNGTSIAAMNLIRTLKSKGHEVKVLCPYSDIYKGQEGFYFLPIVKLPKIFQNIVDKNNVVIGKADIKMFKAVMSDCDIVHIMFPLFIGPKAAKYAKTVLHKPVTVGFHCQAENVSSHLFGLMDSRKFNNAIYKYYYKTIYSYADIIHYPTFFIKNTFEEIVGPTNGSIISNGVQSAFEPKKVKKKKELEGKKVILFTGRLSKEKSHKVLIKAVAESKYKDDIQLVFAGKGPRENEIIKLSKKLLKNQPVIGFYSREELIDIINMADLYVHPAAVEIEAISCLEAIKCGQVPVIANSPKCATKAFALDDRSLFKVNDSSDLAKKIDYWFDNPDELMRMKKEYAKSAIQFDFNVCMDKMEEMLISAIQLNKKK